MPNLPAMHGFTFDAKRFLALAKTEQKRIELRRAIEKKMTTKAKLEALASNEAAAVGEAANCRTGIATLDEQIATLERELAALPPPPVKPPPPKPRTPWDDLPPHLRPPSYVTDADKPIWLAGALGRMLGKRK